MTHSNPAFKRRTFLAGLSTASLAGVARGETEPVSPALIQSPPVIQNPTATSVNLTWMVNGFSTGWVEWGLTEALGQTSLPATHGLVQAHDLFLHARITDLPPEQDIYYRVMTTPITYKTAYQIQRGATIAGPVRRLRRPKSTADHAHLAMVNDTHENATTLSGLSQRIQALQPDALFWNGDSCNNFYDARRLGEICLQPGADPENLGAGGWAAEHPLFFVAGNHDVRGSAARILPQALTPWPSETSDPQGLGYTGQNGGRYCFATRIGPLAIVALDTGEDKPDRREVFAGLAAFEPYRIAQREWLLQTLQTEAIRTAPHLIAFCHIPLRGLPGHNDGQTDTDYAWYSGHGQSLWLSPLIEAGCKAVFSGHTHQHRIDLPTNTHPIHQIVGGGPKPEQATLTRILARPDALEVIIENLAGEKLAGVSW